MIKPLQVAGMVALVCCASIAGAQQKDLYASGSYVIPYPREVKLTTGDFVFDDRVTITLDKSASEADRFAAAQLEQHIRDELKINAANQQSKGKGPSIILTRKGSDKKLTDEGYHLLADAEHIVIQARGEAGLFYGVQTLIQLIRNQNSRFFVKGIAITDWPDTKIRAAHYDTKHHQDTREYVERFIRDLARYKINMLVWEWEDKFLYPSHPEIGAPGAFTMQEMQEITRYAKKFHIQVTPLVQGLGHASYILKWRQFAHLREIAASNFEFCPLKDGTYQLLADLWKDAIAATPGSEYIHIGSDETYELGLCKQCQEKEKEIGKTGLYHVFTSRSSKNLQAAGRQVMVWERPMGWVMGENAAPTHQVAPQKGLVLTESYDYETPDLKYARQAKALGYPVFAYDPNPGVEPLFLPYFFRKPHDFAVDTIIGSLENSYKFLTSSLGKKAYDGVIKTSWDDAGLHNQIWMLSFLTTAAYSWNASAPSLPDFTNAFFKNYYGEGEKNLQRLFYLLNEGGLFYMETLERHVWHDKSIGKTRIPDFPRADIMEYNPFWNKEYAQQVRKSEDMLMKMKEASAICEVNAVGNLKNAYDLEVYKSIVEMVRHTAQLYLDLSSLEKAIAEAHRQHFLDHAEAYRQLEKATAIIQSHLDDRKQVMESLTATWQKTRLPKGMSTADKTFFFEQDRTVHYANRAPDMSFLVMDERLLQLEEYLQKLDDYKKMYKNRFLDMK